MQNIGAALCSFVAICQVNRDPEKKRKDLIAALELLLNGNGTSNPTTLFKRVKKENAGLLELSKEHLIEMRRLLWTTPKNLNDWFDEWGLFCVEKGFATRSEHDGEVVFSEAQKRRIINIDETNLSLDGSDGGRGGRPASTITIKHCQRPGTAQNKAGLSSSLMCRSNAAGEAMPLHIMFSSKAEEENMTLT